MLSRPSLGGESATADGSYGWPASLSPSRNQ